ncbi:MAG: hypothetical protein BWY11_00303 [Firmicutes bacterium ADurb.Bin182]|nr:MAG: hypothetical protein BWY11_00303 [Firmicutes bacterium ADurb.Bin182]
MHELACFTRLALCFETLRAEAPFDPDLLMRKLRENVSGCLTYDTEVWSFEYVCKPSLFFSSPDGPFYTGNEALAEYECEYIIKSRRPEGVWDINWKWADYDLEFAVSENWWKADRAVKNMLYLNGFGRLDI